MCILKYDFVICIIPKLIAATLMAESQRELQNVCLGDDARQCSKQFMFTVIMTAWLAFSCVHYYRERLKEEERQVCQC